MVRFGKLGVDLQDETKEMSTENKVVDFHLFGKCRKCKEERELERSMFTDNCGGNFHSFTGWKYKCKCGNVVEIWEGSFDSAIESFYEENLVEEREEF